MRMLTIWKHKYSDKIVLLIAYQMHIPLPNKMIVLSDASVAKQGIAMQTAHKEWYLYPYGRSANGEPKLVNRII